MNARTPLLLVLAAAGCAAPHVPPGDGALSGEAVNALRAANAAADRHDWPAALEGSRAARRLEPRSHAPLYAMARACDSMGGADAAAIAYYRACLSALPGGGEQAAKPLLARIAELDRHAQAEAQGIISQARQGLTALGEDIWRAGPDRAATLRTLDSAAEKLRSLPGFPSSSAFSASSAASPSLRGAPSALADTETEAWVALGDEVLRLIQAAVDGLHRAKSGPPEQSVAALAALADSQADALARTRQTEARWQEAWTAVAPGR